MREANRFKIVILEDSDFYNKILTLQLRRYTEEIQEEKGYTFEIQSFTSPNDCIRNLGADTDIAIVDFYLGEHSNALSILKTIKQISPACKVIVISKARNLDTYYQSINEGAYHFIPKDEKTLSNCCYIVDDIISERNARC